MGGVEDGMRTAHHRGAALIAIVAFGVGTTCDAALDPPGPSISPARTQEPAPSTPSPEPSPTPKEEENEVVVVAAGDIVCGTEGFEERDPRECQHRETAKLVRPADAVLALGDLQYDDGSAEAFRLLYDPTWGRFADITYPTIGNHDYGTPGAAGYFGYWRSQDRPAGAPGRAYYGFDLGAWHLISLDSNCFSCTEGSAQDRFLERDLARTNEECILAFWHHPYFNSGTVHDEERLHVVQGFWQDLHAAGADVVLHGHEHNYQRYAKQDPSGSASPRGIRQFIVGTGGRNLYALRARPDPNLQAGDDRHFGVLRLTLGERSYSWEFVATGGAVLDRGGPTPCN
jgi:acid phosphatase type 7